jgi:CheY-like chemotaxis protein
MRAHARAPETAHFGRSIADLEAQTCAIPPHSREQASAPDNPPASPCGEGGALEIGMLFRGLHSHAKRKDRDVPPCPELKPDQRSAAMNTRRGSGTRNLSEVRRVLIVDDNRDSAELLALLLGREGHEIRVAHDGAEALRVAAPFGPNIVFLDIGLPDMSGYELLKLLRVRPELSGCTFVAVTGYEEPRPGSGAPVFDAHLVKPIDLNAVVRLVREVGASALAKPASA